MTQSKIIAKKEVFKSRHFSIDHITVGKNGKTFEKDLIERIPIVLVLPYTKDNEVYLELQYRDAFEKKILEVVAGSMDHPDEEPLTAAKRELKEETGLSAATWKPLGTWELSVNMKAKIHVFLATDLTEGQAHLDEDEIIEVVKMPLNEALIKIETGEIMAASHIALLLLFDKLRKEGKI
jgi:ADP-ribose pyrophosphatase